MDDDFVDDFSGKTVYVAIPKVLKRAAKAIVAHPDQWSRVFLRELNKIDGGFNTLFDSMLEKNDTYDLFADNIYSNDKKCAKKLAKALNRHYLEYLDEMGLDEGVSEPMNRRLSQNEDNFGGPALQGNAGPSFAGSTAHMNQVGTMPRDPNGMLPKKDGKPLSMAGSFIDAMEGPNGMPPNEGGAFGGGGAAGGPASSFSPLPGQMPGAMNPYPGNNPSESKLFGYNHLINEMGSYNNMREAMTKFLDTK